MNESENPNPLGVESRETESRVAIPMYSPESQFSVGQLKQEYPEWSQHYEGDAELTAINYHRTQILRKLGQETGIGGNIMLETGGSGLEWAIDHTPKEVGLEYDAHGIAGKTDPVIELDILLKDGIKKDRPFYSMSFLHSPEAGAALGADRPFTSGGLIVVAERGKKLQNDGIRYVVVGEEYVGTLDILKKRYPEVAFIPWHDVLSVFAKQVNEAEGKSIAVEEFNDDNKPHYHIPKRLGNSGATPIIIQRSTYDEKEIGDDDIW